MYVEAIANSRAFYVFLPFPHTPPLARFVNPQAGPDLAERIHDGDLITNSGFFDPAFNRLRVGYFPIYTFTLATCLFTTGK